MDIRRAMMAESVTLSQLSTTLNLFNESLNHSNKLDDNALRTIQEYLNNSTVTVLDQEDEERMQHTLKHLQKLKEPTIITRVSSTEINKINRQLKNLEQLIAENSNAIIRDAYFIIANLEVCFLDILSDEAENSNKYWQNIFEEKMVSAEKSQPVSNTLNSNAFYMDRQQRLINELMNAVLFNVIEYFEEKQQSFDTYFTQKFLDKLFEKSKNPSYVLRNNLSNDIFNILLNTANHCNLPMVDLVRHLRYAIIDMDERMYQYIDLLENYIREADSPTLMNFNKMIPSSWALSSKEVELFSGLFDFYCEMLLLPTEEMLEDRLSQLQISPKAMRSASETVTESTNEIHIAKAQPSGICARPSSATTLPPEQPLSTDVGLSRTHIQLQSTAPPPISLETDIKFVWIESNVEQYYAAYRDIIEPASITHFNPTEILSKIPNDWINSRIFLCLSVKDAKQILSHVCRIVQPYRVYVLCNEKSEENAILRNDEIYSKIQLITSDENAFIQQLAIDIIPSLIEIGDLYLKTREYDNAQRWFQTALDYINVYDKSKEKFLVPLIEKRLSQCSR